MKEETLIIQLIGWIAYAFGPIICFKLLWDTYKHKATNTYLYIAMWIPPELMAFYYNWETTMAWPIMANCLCVSFLTVLTIIVQYYRKPRNIKAEMKELIKEYEDDIDRKYSGMREGVKKLFEP